MSSSYSWLVRSVAINLNRANSKFYVLMDIFPTLQVYRRHYLSIIQEEEELASTAGNTPSSSRTNSRPSSIYGALPQGALQAVPIDPDLLNKALVAPAPSIAGTSGLPFLSKKIHPALIRSGFLWISMDIYIHKRPLDSYACPDQSKRNRKK